MNSLHTYLQADSSDIILKIIGLLLTILLGIFSLIWTHRVAPVLGYEKKLSTLGSIEFKATYGGFFLSLGILGLYLKSPDAFLLIGCSWVAAGITRLILFSIARTDNFKNSAGLFVEFGIGLLILFG